MVETITKTITVMKMTCEVCGYSWESRRARTALPLRCQRKMCNTRSWNGQKRRSRAHQLVFPAPRPGGRRKTNAAIDLDDDAE